MPAKSTSYYMKTAILSGALFIESLMLTAFLKKLAFTENYFDPSFSTILHTALLLLLIAYTYALTVGAWDKWEQYVIVPVPVCAGIFVIAISIDAAYALLLTLACFLILLYDIDFSAKLREQLIKFNPQIILRFSTKGLLFVFALVGAFLVVVSPSAQNIDLTGGIADVVHGQVTNIVSRETGVSVSDITQVVGEGSIRTFVKSQLDALLDPYKEFFVIIVAFFTLGLIQLINGIIYALFSVTIGTVFALAKKVGFFRTETKQVDQEILRF